jgi:hypothetical protein
VCSSDLHVVRTLQLAAVRTFLERFDFERIVAAAHAALGRRSFSLRYSHLGTCILNYFKIDATSEQVRHRLATDAKPIAVKGRPVIAKSCAYSGFCRTSKSFLG